MLDAFQSAAVQIAGSQTDVLVPLHRFYPSIESFPEGVRKHRFPDNNKDFGINRLCDLHPHGTRTDGDLVLSVVTPLVDDYALYDDGKCTLQSAAEGGQLIVRLDDDKTLGRELRTHLRLAGVGDRAAGGSPGPKGRDQPRSGA